MKTKLARYTPLALATLVSTTLLIAAAVLYTPQPKSRSVPVKEVPFYQLPWGNNPFYPGELRTPDMNFIDPQMVPSAAQCANCHRKEFEEFSASLHSVTGRDVIYDLTIERNAHFDRAHGPERIRFCEACHEPIQLLAGATNRVRTVMPADAMTEGLGCVGCHTAIHTDPNKGNGSLTLDLARGRDRLSDPLILASPRDHALAFGSKSTTSIIGTSEFCAACHVERYHPMVSKVEGVVTVQSTYQEWKNSWYAEQGITCQDCHMNPNPAAYLRALKQNKVEKPKRYSHRFIGAHYLLVETNLESNLFFLRGGVLPGLTGERYMKLLQEQKRMTHAFLKEAAEIKVEILPTKEEALEIAVNVKNVGAGHNLPTGVNDQKHIWLEVKVRDATGQVLYHSGWLDEGGRLDPQAIVWAERFWAPDGHRILDHLTFRTARVDWVRKPIPPRGQQRVVYRVPVPKGATPPLTVESTLWYRVAFQEFINHVLKTTLTIPAFPLAEAQVVWNPPRSKDGEAVEHARHP